MRVFSFKPEEILPLEVLVLICLVNIFLIYFLGLKCLEIFCHQLQAGMMGSISLVQLP